MVRRNRVSAQLSCHLSRLFDAYANCILSSLRDRECLALLQGHTSLVGQLQLTDDVLVTGGSDGRVLIYSLKTFECLRRLWAHDNSVTCLQFDDRFIVTGGNDGRVKLWDFASGNYVRELCAPSEAVWKVNYRDDKWCVRPSFRERESDMSDDFD